MRLQIFLTRDKSGQIERSKALLAFEKELDTMIREDASFVARVAPLLMQNLLQFSVTYPGGYINASILANDIGFDQGYRVNVDNVKPVLQGLVMDGRLEKNPGSEHPSYRIPIK